MDEPYLFELMILPGVPQILGQEPVEDFMVSISEFDFLLRDRVELGSLKLQVEVVDEGVDSCKNESNDGGYGIDGVEWLLVSTVHQVDELQAAGKASCDILVENYGIEVEEGPAIESYPHVPPP